MKNIARIEPEVIGGVDTHQDLHTAAVVTPDGTPLGTGSFPTTRAGYRKLLAWMRSHGKLLRVGVESTGTYGAGLVRLLAREGVPVLEVTAPDPAARRGKGKDDMIDAVAAAQAAASGQRVQVAKDRNGQVEALRVLRTTRKTAVKCRRATLQQLHNTIVAAPEDLRDELRHFHPDEAAAHLCGMATEYNGLPRSDGCHQDSHQIALPARPRAQRQDRGTGSPHRAPCCRTRSHTCGPGGSRHRMRRRTPRHRRREPGAPPFRGELRDVVRSITNTCLLR